MSSLRVEEQHCSTTIDLESVSAVTRHHAQDTCYIYMRDTQKLYFRFDNMADCSDIQTKFEIYLKSRDNRVALHGHK
jgi:hypothetical protein